MRLYKRGEVYHYDFALNGERFRGTTSQRLQKDAATHVKGLIKRLEAEHELGDSARRKALTLAEVADRWFAASVAGKKTAITTAMRLKILFRHIDGALPVAQVGPREIADAILSRRVEPIRQSPKDGEPRLPSNATVNRDLIDSTLRPLMNYAEDTLEEPVRRIKWTKLRLKEPKGRVRNFTAEEMSAWRGELPEWHRPLFDFMARYGVRLDEAFFPPSAVNVEASEVTLFDTKNGTDHALQIEEGDMADMAARKTRATEGKLDTIWYRDVGGDLTPIHWRGFQSASREALDRAGILNARPAHDLRHHAATTLYRATGNIKLVQDLLNHQSITSSARYAHTNKADLRNALRDVYGTKEGTSGPKKPKTAIKSAPGNGT